MCRLAETTIQSDKQVIGQVSRIACNDTETYGRGSPVFGKNGGSSPLIVNMYILTYSSSYLTNCVIFT